MTDGSSIGFLRLMHAALDINMPNYARAILATNEVIDLISSTQTMETTEPA